MTEARKQVYEELARTIRLHGEEGAYLLTAGFAAGCKVSEALAAAKAEAAPAPDVKSAAEKKEG